jgi:hypothetical protein
MAVSCAAFARELTRDRKARCARRSGRPANDFEGYMLS